MKKKIKFRRFNRELFLVATYAGCLSAFFTAWDGLSDGFGTELTQFVIYGAVLMIVGVVAWAASSNFLVCEWDWMNVNKSYKLIAA